MRDLNADGIKGVPFAEIADRALKAEQAEKDILDEERAIRRDRLEGLSEILGLVIKKVEEDRLRYNVLRMQK